MLISTVCQTLHLLAGTSGGSQVILVQQKRNFRFQLGFSFFVERFSIRSLLLSKYSIFFFDTFDVESA
jgi:hypothetical protein